MTRLSLHLQLWCGHCSEQAAGMTEKGGSVLGPGSTQNHPPHNVPQTPEPSVSHDNHAQLVSKVLHLMDLDKCSCVVDLIQALDHVGLVTEGERHKGTSAQAL